MSTPKLRVKHYREDYFVIEELVTEQVFFWYKDTWESVKEVFSAVDDPRLWNNDHPLISRDYEGLCRIAEHLAQGDNLERHKHKVAQEWDELMKRKPEALKACLAKVLAELKAQGKPPEDKPIRHFG
jgi:hypothetical protein